MIWDVVVVVGILWIYMSLLSFIQTVHLQNAVKELRELGKDLYVEKNGRLLNVRLYLIVAVDESGMVLAAKRLRTALWVVPPRLRPYPEIVGRPLRELDADLTAYNRLTGKALGRLCERYRRQQAAA